MIIMNKDVLFTIKNTLEDTINIKVLSLHKRDNIVFGIYVNDIIDSLSFLSLPQEHIETNIDGVEIQFYELGAILHNIYFNGAISFLDILLPNDDIMKGSDKYMDLCNLVTENLPFNIAKLKYIESLNENFVYSDDIEKVEMLMYIMRDFILNLISFSDESPSDFVYVDKINDAVDFLSACNALEDFKQWLEVHNFKKISEKKINDINKIYFDLQMEHSKS